MVRLFAALRFAEDINISDRTYWYLTDFPVKAGERVLAPVGMHDRLQRAVVERVVDAEEKDAPYDVRLLKRVAAKEGARKLTAGGEVFRELGGVRYDEKHYTRLGRVLVGERAASAAARAELAAYGVTEWYDADGGETAELLRALSCERGCTLLAGRNAGMAGALLLLLVGVPRAALPADVSAAPPACMGEADAERLLADMGLAKGEIFRLRERLR